MPKLRNGDTDLEKFTQWIGRKCRNHNPLAELEVADREKLPRMHGMGKNRGQVNVVASDRNILIYQAAGRLFEITVREVEPEVYEGVELAEVGY